MPYVFTSRNGNSEFIQMDDEGHPAPAPPPYKDRRADYGEADWYDVRYWAWWVWATLILGTLIIVGVVVVAVVEVQKNRYPNYTKLDYVLSEMYSGDSFFTNFDYFTGYDPTHGFVHYVPSEQAKSLNLTYAGDSTAILRVDTSVNSSSVPNASTGRFSVRVTSKNTYGLQTLFLFTVKHTPTGCATWPALWLTDPSNWPYNGEIDVMEQVNVQGTTDNQMTLHTSSGCTMKGVKREMVSTSKVLTSSCVNSTDNNAGCGVSADNQFGDSWNNNGGGVLALELRKEGIRLWQFANNAIPQDIIDGTSPDPSSWSTPTADFPGTDCDISTHFRNQSIIADIDLCGDWAGADTVYGASCPGTCSDFVANNNTAFTDAYWEFGEFRIYSG